MSLTPNFSQLFRRRCSLGSVRRIRCKGQEQVHTKTQKDPAPLCTDHQAIPCVRVRGATKYLKGNNLCPVIKNYTLVKIHPPTTEFTRGSARATGRTCFPIFLHTWKHELPSWSIERWIKHLLPESGRMSLKLQYETQREQSWEKACWITHTSKKNAPTKKTGTVKPP